MTEKTAIKLAILFFMSMLFGCKENSKIYTVEVVKINPKEAKEINLSEIVDSVKYIKLQTKDCEMGRLYGIIIKEKYIYALDLDQQILFVFDKNGEFVSKLDKQGRGPDDYLHMGPVFIDKDEKFIELINNNGKNTSLLKYSNISFKLLSKKPFPRISANSCNRLGDIYYFATQQIENSVNGELINAGIIIAENDSVVKTLFEKKIITNNSSFSAFGESFIKNRNGELFASIMYDNTFYKLDGLNAEPVFSVDFGNDGIDNTIGLKPIDEQWNYLRNVNGLASFPVLDINNPEIMVFSYWFRTNSDKNQFYKPSDFYQYIHLKESNKAFHVRKIKNDITNFPDEIQFGTYARHVNHEVWYKDYLVDVILPGYYFTEENESATVDGIGEVTIQDNPVIVLMKLKRWTK